MKKKLLWICGGLLSVVVVLGGVFNYYIKPKYVAPMVIAVEEFLLENEETIELLIQEYGDDFAADVALDDETDKNKVLEAHGAGGSNDETDESLGVNHKENITNKNIETNQESENRPSKQTNKKTVIGGKTMAELQKEVEPSDLKAGLKIASKIDAGHLLGLTKGGLTAEKKQQAKSHLTSRLTPSEFSQLKGFVGKYAYLLK